MSVPLLDIEHPQAIARAAEALADGGLVVLPTDTVYGVAANLWDEEAVAAIYKVKKRLPDKAIPILLAETRDALKVVAEMPQTAQVLADAFWPGALTLVMPKRAEVPAIVSALPTIGVRVPDHDGTRAVIRAAGGRLAVTSANHSGAANSLTAQEAAEALGDALALILDGGRCSGGLPSTVVDVSRDTVKVLRDGPLSDKALRDVLARAGL